MHKAKFSLEFRSNPTMWLMILAVVILQLAALYLPILDQFFDVMPLKTSNLLLCIALTITIYVPVKLEKILHGDKAI